MSELPSRFGPYEILSPLGAGGMGQVFRARDTRLQRLVAIKVLHDDAALDLDRQRRFAQEALAASALNHPNILTVYDVGTENGTPYLVSELIDGEPLRVEMNRGRLPLKRVVEVMHQVAEGLAAAHEAGIFHRDLKPENVMVTADGRVKIVDFGLAKAPLTDNALDPTHATETAAGLIVGTVPYMSPEQARGAPADFRSDQFSFGLLLYELATGAHPFKRDTAVQTLSAIIADEAPDLAQLAPALPVSVRWLLRRLLAKHPRERFASTVDLAADLRTLREHLSEATSASGVHAVTVPARRTHWQLRAAAGVVIFALGAFVSQILTPADAVARFDRFTPLATDAGYQGAPSWSPDGKSIVYEAEINGVVQIFTRTLGSVKRTQVTRSAFDCFSPIWSSDGSIYYHSQARDLDALWRVSPVGGNPEMVIEGASRSTISPDGRTVFFLRDQTGTQYHFSLWYASPLDGTPQPYTRGLLKDKIVTSGTLRFAPDGARLLAWLAPSDTSDSGFWEIPFDDGEPRQVLPELNARATVPITFSWLPDNRHIVTTRAGVQTSGVHLWLADTAGGGLFPLTTTPGNEGWPSVAPDGRTIAFSSEATDFDLFEVPIDGSAPRVFLSSSRNEFDPAASPVTTQFAYVTDRTGPPQIWLQNREGYLEQPLVTETDFDDGASLAIGSLAFSPDGSKLAFQRASGSSGSATGRRIWITPVTGGKPFPMSGGLSSYYDAPTWAPDGDWIAYLSAGAGDLGRVALMKSQVGGRTPPVRLLENVPSFVTRPQWSPDGNWLVCETVDGLTLVAADGSSQRLIGEPGWFAYAWGRDGRQIYGLRPTDDQHHIMLVSVDVRTGEQRVINKDLGTVPQALQPIRGFSRLPNGAFLTSIARVKSDIHLIENFRLPRPRWFGLWPFGYLQPSR